MSIKTTIALFLCAATTFFGAAEKNKPDGAKLSLYANITDRRLIHDSVLPKFHDSAFYKYYDIVSLTLTIAVTSHARYPINYIITTSDSPFYWGTDSRVFYRFNSDVIKRRFLPLV